MIPERLTPKQLADIDLTDLSPADLRALVSRGTVLEQQARAAAPTHARPGARPWGADAQAGQHHTAPLALVGGPP